MSRQYSQICPGRFPSPTPSRETSPEPSLRLESPSVSPQHSVPSLNFTASGSFRKRPHLADSQSEPVVPRNDDQASSLPSSHLSPAIHATNRRRVSDPLQSSMQNPSPGERRRIRAVSAQSVRRPRSPQITRPPILPSTSTSSHLIDVQLRAKLRETLTPKDALGTIYMLQVESRPEFGTKIGYTRRADYTKRINEHQDRCNLVLNVIAPEHDVENCFRVEQLVLLELRHLRQNWWCEECKSAKGTVHEEWSQVTGEEAKTAVRKWTTFMNEQRPYDSTGSLAPLWSYLLRERKLTAGADHDARREQWNAMLAAPTYREYCAFTIDRLVRTWRAILAELSCIRPWCEAFFWQMSTVIYGFVALVAFRNSLASSAFAVFSLCACISVAHHAPGLKLLAKSRRKS